MGVSGAAIREHLVYVRPQTEFSEEAVNEVIARAVRRGVRLVVIDSVGEAFAIEGIDENKDSEVGPWYRRVARAIADSGPAVLIIDHSTKSADNPLYPSGSKRKRAAISGAAYLAEAVKPFAKGQGGRLQLKCAKDRHGNYRRGETVANLVMDVSLTDAVRMELYAPDRDDRADVPDGERAAREAVRAAKAVGVPVSLTALRALMKGMSTDEKRAGIEIAIGRGALIETGGARGARNVQYVSELPDPTSP